MLKRLTKPDEHGIAKWKIWVRLPDRIVHQHVLLTEMDATQLYADLLKEKSRDAAGLASTAPASTATLAAAADRYQRELESSGYNADHCKQVAFSLDLLQAQLPANFQIARLTRQHIATWKAARLAQAYRGKTPTARTINKGLAHLSAFCAWAALEGLIETNPAQYVVRQKEVAGVLRMLSWRDACKIADAAWAYRPDVGLLVEVLMETGARVGEVIRAKCGDVDASRGVWTKIVKPGKTLQIDAAEWVLACATGRNTDAPLCPTVKGETWCYENVRHAIEALRARCGFKDEITAHWFRHGRACWDLIDSKSVWEVKTKLGHASVTITERYLRSAELLKREESGQKLSALLDCAGHHRRGLRVAMCCKKAFFSPFPHLFTTPNYASRRSRKHNNSKGFKSVS